MNKRRLVFFAHYTFVDYATQGYIVIVGIIVLFFHGPNIKEWPALSVMHAAGFCFIHWMIKFHAKSKAGKFFDLVRYFYPALLYAALYRETGYLNQIQGGYWDAGFIRVEQRIFGSQPSLHFMEQLPYGWVGEIFYASYFSYYAMIGAVGIALFLRSHRQFHQYVSVVSFVFYICYLIFIFVPVAGPRVFYNEVAGYHLPQDLMPPVVPEFPAAIKAGVFYRVMGVLYDSFEAPGAAFPSSHVAIAFCTVWFSFLYLRRIRWAHLIVFLLLSAATVYCRYHYLIDVFAGLVTGGTLVPLGNWLYRKWGGAEPDAPAARG